MPDSNGTPYPWEAPMQQSYAVPGMSSGYSMPTGMSSWMGNSPGTVPGFNAPITQPQGGGSMYAGGGWGGSGGEAAPAAPAGGGGFWGSGGFNIGSVGTIAQGLGSLAGAYMGFKNYKLAKEGLDLSKEAFNVNMNNSIKQYNTSLEDRIRGRSSAYENKESDVQSYLARHSLSR